MVGTSLAAKYGVLIKGADVLEKINKIDTVVFGKTNILTNGNYEVKQMLNCRTQFRIQKASKNDRMIKELMYLAEKSI